MQFSIDSGSLIKLKKMQMINKGSNEKQWHLFRIRVFATSTCVCVSVCVCVCVCVLQVIKHWKIKV